MKKRIFTERLEILAAGSHCPRRRSGKIVQSSTIGIDKRIKLYRKPRASYIGPAS